MKQIELEATVDQTSKWNTYQAYKETGIDWLGVVPNHWKIKRLGHVSKVIDPQPDHRAPTLSEVEGFPYVGIRDVNPDGTINVDTARKIEEEALIKQETSFRIDTGDIIFCKVGTLGFPRQIKPKGRIALSATLVLIKCNQLVDTKYLLYALDGRATYTQIDLLSTGSTRSALGIEQIRKFRLGVPPISEQCAIAAFLDRETARINTLIAKKEQLIELLQEKRAALISHAVTKGLDPIVSMKDSGVEWLGEIPAHWEVKRLKHVASILRGKFSHRPRNDPRLYDGSYPFIQTGDITSTTKYITDYHQTLNELGFAVSKQFPSNTLVMSIAANIGDLAILQIPACFPDSIVGFVPAPQVALNYLYYNLTAMKQEMVGTATINTQLNLNVERIGCLYTTFPLIGEQYAIATYLDRETGKIDALIARIREGIGKLKEYSTALISAAVTGKIDVRGESAYAD